VVKRVDSHHEGAYTNHFILCIAHFYSTVEDAVEFADLVSVTDFFKKSFDLVFAAGDLEVVLADAALSEGSRGKEVDCLRLITVVLIVSHGLAVLIGDVSSD